MLRILFLTALSAILFTGCASSDQQTQNSTDTTAPVSTIPWNKPQSWEGGGAMGGAAGR